MFRTFCEVPKCDPFSGVASGGRQGDAQGEGRTAVWDDNWAKKARCQQNQPDELFVQGAAQNRAKQVCQGCPVRTECLAEALDNRTEFGVWGGMTERERRALLRRRPNVTSWRKLLETARDEHVRGVAPKVTAAAG
jgi:WhiB family redox-sensing transcriptional regulator